MMKIKVHGGATPVSGPPLCKTCKYARQIKGQNCQELIFCQQDIFGEGRPVPFRVAECGSYLPFNQATMYEMEKIAWKIEARKKGPTGFQKGVEVPPEMEVVVTPPKTRNEPLWQDDPGD